MAKFQGLYCAKMLMGSRCRTQEPTLRPACLRGTPAGPAAAVTSLVLSWLSALWCLPFEYRGRRKSHVRAGSARGKEAHLLKNYELPHWQRWFTLAGAHKVQDVGENCGEVLGGIVGVGPTCPFSFSCAEGVAWAWQGSLLSPAEVGGLF